MEEYLNKPYWVIDILPKQVPWVVVSLEIISDITADSFHWENVRLYNIGERKLVCEISPYRKGMEDYYNTYFLLIAFH